MSRLFISLCCFSSALFSECSEAANTSLMLDQNLASTVDSTQNKTVIHGGQERHRMRGSLKTPIEKNTTLPQDVRKLFSQGLVTSAQRIVTKPNLPMFYTWWSPWVGGGEGGSGTFECPLGFITEFTVVADFDDGIFDIDRVTCNDGAVLLNKVYEADYALVRKRLTSSSGFSSMSGVYGISNYDHWRHLNKPQKFWKLCLNDQCEDWSQQVQTGSPFSEQCGTGAKLAGFQLRPEISSTLWDSSAPLGGIRLLCHTQGKLCSTQLIPVQRSHCPNSTNHLLPCHLAQDGNLCLATGRCLEDTHVNNCASKSVYVREPPRYD